MYFADENEENILSRLLKVRTVLVTGEVDQELAERVITQLLVLDAESHDPIRVIITSSGGQVDSGLAIHDVMKYIQSPVSCIGAGWVARIAVSVLFGADKERRFALPNTRFLLHQPGGVIDGLVPDIRIEAQEILKLRERLNEMISRETGQPVEKIQLDSDRNFWMSTQEALEYGLVAKIVKSTNEVG